MPIFAKQSCLSKKIEGDRVYALVSIFLKNKTPPLELITMRTQRDSVYAFLDKSISLASNDMDVVTKFGSAQGCAVRTGAL